MYSGAGTALDLRDLEDRYMSYSLGCKAQLETDICETYSFTWTSRLGLEVNPKNVPFPS